jgi:3D (Asp-Asp-Asp) domain-containing protein
LVAHRVTLGEGRFVDDIFPGEQKSLIASWYTLSGDGLYYSPFESLSVEVPTKEHKSDKTHNVATKTSRPESEKKGENKKFLWKFLLSRYYSCDRLQTKRLAFEPKSERNYKWCMNRQFLWDGDPTVTADWTKLTNSLHANKTLACPRKYMWKTLIIEWYWEYLCNDVGGAIKWKRLDVYAWIWDYAIDNWSKVPTWHKNIWIK